MSVAADVAFVRAAMRTGVLISFEVCWTLGPLLDLVEDLAGGPTNTTEVHMAKVPLQGVSLSQLGDGYAGRAIDAALAELTRDIDERGDDGKPRKLTITVTLTPEGKGHVEIDVQVATKAPAFRPPATKAKVDQRAGGLIFNPDCSDNPDQKTFADLKGDRDAEE